MIAKRKVPLLDLRALHQPIRDEVLAAIASVVDSNAFILGEDVKQLEKSIAAYCHVPYAVGCGSGSDALLLALMAAGGEPGDAVLTTPFTFFATAGSIVLAGATPVFVDIDAATYNMDPQALAETIRRTPRAKVVMPVHLYGGCADMDPILETARSRDCVVIEDGAQSIGAEYKGRRAQSMGDIGCLSFYPTKNLGAFGEGGMVLTQNEGHARKLAALRVHGATEKYFHEWVGLNSRLDTVQAAVLPASALGKAISYTLSLWHKLTRFLEHPELELSNNLAENSMRPVALGRKNWIHVGSEQAGPKVAAILSVIESCRRLKLPVREYLASILPGLANLPVQRVSK